MHRQPSKSTLKTKKHSSQIVSEPTILEESARALQALQQLFKMRLIDRIARPRDRIDKQQDLNAFAFKLQRLHDIMFKIKHEMTGYVSAQRVSEGKKGMFGSSKQNIKLSANSNLKKYIRSIETRYTQILMEGSFKYCRKVCQALSLNYSQRLALMMVDQWAASCLQDNPQQTCC